MDLAPYGTSFGLEGGFTFAFGQLYGSGASTGESSPFTDAELATRQFFLRPVARVFL